MTKEEVNYAIDRTKHIIEFNGYQTYSDYSFICGCSNENQSEIAKKIDYKNKEILTVAASGEQYFSAQLAGAKKVTLYDINNLAQLYVYLKIGAMKKLNYDDFISFFIPEKTNNNYFDINTLSKIYNYLPDFVSNYWYNILKRFGNDKLDKLITFPRVDNIKEYIINGEKFFIRENYDKLKKNIENKEYPNFVSSSIYDIPNKLNNQKFDVIDTSNIIECIIGDSWVFDCYSDDLIPKWINLVENKLTNLLNKNGQIIVDYEPSKFNKELIDHPGFQKYKINSKDKTKGKSLMLVYKKQ